MTATIETPEQKSTRLSLRSLLRLGYANDTLEAVAVALADNLARLEDARISFEGIDEAIDNLRYSVTEADELRELVLAEHRESHVEPSPRFCVSAVCRKAAGEW